MEIIVEIRPREDFEHMVMYSVFACMDMAQWMWAFEVGILPPLPSPFVWQLSRPPIS